MRFSRPLAAVLLAACVPDDWTPPARRDAGADDTHTPATCPLGTTRCGSVCARLAFHAAHCGACGRACVPGERCLGGVCTSPDVHVEHLSGGDGVTYAVMSDGTVRAAGHTVGAYEGVVNARRGYFVAVPELRDVVEMSAGCGRRRDGTVWCKPGREPAVQVGGLHGAVQISGTCARRADHTVACWTGDAAFKATPREGITDAVDLSCNGYNCCAARIDGTVWCWGDVGVFLSDTAPVSRVATVPERIAGLTDVTALSARGASLCAVIRDGTVRCLGRRQLVLADMSPRYNTNVGATVIANLTNVRAVVAGLPNYALRRDGTVVAWGVNIPIVAGDGVALMNSESPVEIEDLRGVREIAPGSSTHLCALLEDGTPRCLGDDTNGQLGIGGGILLEPRAVVAGPGSPEPLTGVLEDDVGGGFHCTRHADAVRCWGNDESGELGRGVSSAVRAFFPSPLLVPGLTDAVAMSTLASGRAGAFMCVLVEGGGARCWGANRHGSLGDGTFFLSNAPVDVLDLTGATQITGGDAHACALLADETVRCWGRGDPGSLGNGTTDNSEVPVTIAGLRDIVEIGAGRYLTLARARDGTIYAWGALDGLTPTPRVATRPQVLEGVRDATQLSISGGQFFQQVCALRREGRVSCIGTGGASPGSWFDLGLSGAVQLSGGARVTCARLADSSLRCWGVNEQGALGNASLPHTTAYVATPTPVLMLDGTLFTGVARVRVGPGHACAIMNDRTLRCWGIVSYGITGAGFGQTIPRPVRPVGL